MEEDFSTLQTFSWLFTINNRTWCNHGLTLSDLHKSLFEGTVEEIMWGSPSIPITIDWTDSKVDSVCVRVSELFRTEFHETRINNCQTG